MERLAGSYYQYTGSHPFDSCANANWIVYEEPITVSEMQLNKLRLVILAISKVFKIRIGFKLSLPYNFLVGCKERYFTLI